MLVTAECPLCTSGVCSIAIDGHLGCLNAAAGFGKHKLAQCQVPSCEIVSLFCITLFLMPTGLANNDQRAFRGDQHKVVWDSLLKTHKHVFSQ